MLAENSVLRQKNYDGFFELFLLSDNYYFGRLTFQPELSRATRTLDGVNQNCLRTGVFKKYNLADWGR